MEPSRPRTASSGSPLRGLFPIAAHQCWCAIDDLREFSAYIGRATSFMFHRPHGAEDRRVITVADRSALTIAVVVAEAVMQVDRRQSRSGRMRPVSGVPRECCRLSAASKRVPAGRSRPPTTQKSSPPQPQVSARFVCVLLVANRLPLCGEPERMPVDLLWSNPAHLSRLARGRNQAP